MLIFAYCLVGVLVLQVLTNVRWTRQFARDLREIVPVYAETDLPPVAIVLSLRGSDPFLKNCLAGLASQNYPDFHVMIVLDREDDPAAHIVNEFLHESRSKHFEVSVLQEHRPNCTLKVSALIQTIEDLDPRYEIVTVVDADALTYPSWLKDMVGPFVDPKIGVTTGIRWYLADDRTLPTVIRRYWNLGAVVQMQRFGIPWGGSLAIRRSFLVEADQLQRWSTTLCEDTPLAASLDALEYRLQLVPQAVLLNRESIEMKPLMRFIRRQLLFTRMHHPRWFWIQLSALLFAVGSVVAFVTTIVLAVNGQPVALAVGGAMVAHSLSMIVQAKISNRAVREVMRTRRGVELERQRFSFNTILAGVIAMYIQSAGVMQVILNREFEWRGIRYLREGRAKYRIVEYRPYRPAPPHSGQKVQSI